MNRLRSGVLDRLELDLEFKYFCKRLGHEDDDDDEGYDDNYTEYCARFL